MNSSKFLSGSILLLVLHLTAPSLLRASERTAENRKTGNFTAVDFSGVYKVTLVKGETCSVKLEGESGDLASILTEVEGNTLQVSIKSKVKLSSEVFVTVTYVSLNEIEVSGVVSVTATQPITADRFEMDFSGIGNADLSVKANTLNLDISGTGNVTLKGSAKSAHVDISGAGKFQSPDFMVESYEMDISGAGNADINVSKQLDAEISGTGTITYQGSPKVTKEISGMGRVVSR